MPRVHVRQRRYQLIKIVKYTAGMEHQGLEALTGDHLQLYIKKDKIQYAQ